MIDDKINDTRSELAKQLMKPWADMSDRCTSKEFPSCFIGNEDGNQNGNSTSTT